MRRCDHEVAVWTPGTAKRPWNINNSRIQNTYYMCLAAFCGPHFSTKKGQSPSPTIFCPTKKNLSHHGKLAGQKTLPVFHCVSSALSHCPCTLLLCSHRPDLTCAQSPPCGRGREGAQLCTCYRTCCFMSNPDERLDDDGMAVSCEP